MSKAITIESAIEKTREYFNGDELAATVFPTKYALTDKEGNLHEETPDDMHCRMAKEFARIESNYKNPLSEQEIYDMFSSWEVVPQGSPMSGVGNPYQIQSLSNCFVIDSPEDSYAGILHTDQEQVQIMKRRGGVGFDISKIRPKGMATSNAARTTDGIGIFMERFSNSTREVAQGGRRGALMISISCFVGDTYVLTEDGWMRIDKIVNEEYSGRVWTHEGLKPITAFQKFENREVFEIECENGRKITVTPDHEFVVKNIVTGEEYLKPIIEVDPDTEELVFYDE